MPELNGIDATRAIRREHSTTRVLVVSVHCTEATVLDAIEAGASGYVLTRKPPPTSLSHAVQAVARDQSYFSPAVARLLAHRVVEGGKRRTVLSAREREVIQLITKSRAAISWRRLPSL